MMRKHDDGYDKQTLINSGSFVDHGGECNEACTLNTKERAKELANLVYDDQWI